MLLINKIYNKILTVTAIGLTAALAACNNQPKQQVGEVAVDTIKGQDVMIIDTTSSASYGTVGPAPAKGPDLDTFKYIDRGVKHDEVFEDDKQNPRK